MRPVFTLSSSIRPLALFAFLSASGCVVHNYPCKDGSTVGGGAEDEPSSDGEDDTGDQGGGGLLDGDTGEDDDTGSIIDDLPDDTEDPLPAEPPTFTLDPAEVVQGEAIVATLLADDELWDHTAVLDVALESGLVLCSLEIAEDGVVMAFGAWGDAELGTYSASVDIGEDAPIDLTDAIEVVSPGGIVTPDPATDPCTTLD